jgi:hypothetical protein
MGVRNYYGKQEIGNNNKKAKTEGEQGTKIKHNKIIINIIKSSSINK